MEIFRRVIFAAALAGFGAGVVITLLHQAMTVPLIVHAETFEAAAQEPSHESGWHAHSVHERTLATAVSDILMGIGFALILVAIWQWRSETPDWRHGLAWGLGGFLAITVAPGLGLPAELPGTAAAALPARQLWWVATAVVTAGGLGVACFSRGSLRLLALASLALPHLFGAPQPLQAAALAPPELLRAFQLAVYVCNFLFWLVLGGLASYFYRSQTAA